MGNPETTYKGPSRFPSMVAATLGAAGVYWLIDALEPGPSLLATVPPGTRETFFASLAGTCGALLGFAIAAVTILLSAGRGERMTFLAKNQMFREESRFLFTSTILALASATVVFLTMVVVGTDKDGFCLVSGILSAATMALVIERLSRLVRFLDRLMTTTLQDASGQPLPNPEINDD